MSPRTDVLEKESIGDCSIISKDSQSEINLDCSERPSIPAQVTDSQKASNVLPVEHQDAIVLSSDESNQGWCPQTKRLFHKIKTGSFRLSEYF